MRSLRRAQATYDPLMQKLTERRERDLLAAETLFNQKQEDLTAHRDKNLADVGERFKRLRDDVNRHHADDFTRLVSTWKQGCDKFIVEARTVEQEARRWFPPWNDSLWEAWQLPEEVHPWAANRPLRYSPGGHPARRAQGKSFAATGPVEHTLPFFVAVPGEIFFAVPGSGRRQKRGRPLVASVAHALLDRPSGRQGACTIIDPVGRGENFSAFMHLADHEEALINGRIWTEAAHIDQRLTDLTAHMENVLQKYLRNQYETLAEYNEQAGEVAEPYRFLVVADFPVNFTPDAARRLISMAGAGARCGIYTFIMVDMKQALPQGIDLADLQRRLHLS